MAGGTVAYIYPVVGAVAPTAAQVLNVDVVVASIAFGAAADDDDTVITHNMNLSPLAGALGIPEVTAVATAMGAALSQYKIAFTNANSITVGKIVKGVGSDVTWRFTIRRPHTISR